MASSAILKVPSKGIKAKVRVRKSTYHGSGSEACPLTCASCWERRGIASAGAACLPKVAYLGLAGL